MNIPYINAYVVSVPGSTFLLCGPCPHCSKWHTHGIAEGHRSPHCIGQRNSGYIVDIIGSAPEELFHATFKLKMASRRDVVERVKQRISDLLTQVVPYTK